MIIAKMRQNSPKSHLFSQNALPIQKSAYATTINIYIYTYIYIIEIYFKEFFTFSELKIPLQ